MDKQELLISILRDAKIGWWEIDITRRVVILSDYLKQIVGTTHNEVDFDQFAGFIGDAYRKLVINEIQSDKDQLIAEQIFSLVGPEREVLFRWRFLKREKREDGSILLSGYAEELPSDEASGRGEYSAERMNNLLYRLNSISHTLLSFLHAQTTDETIDKVLVDILNMFKASRTYIVELDYEHQIHHCTYEIIAEGIESSREEFDRMSFSDTPWWIDQLNQGSPVIISTLDALPEEARSERELLEFQGVKSIFALPLVSQHKVWGYAGIDMVDYARQWSNEDYQWFASLVNIINICIELQRAKKEAQQERDYFHSLYNNMPLGYVRMKMIYDNNKRLVDYTVVDSNNAADAILGCSKDEYINKKASENNGNLESYIPNLERALQADGYVESNDLITGMDKQVHAILYSTTKDEVTGLLSDTTDVHKAHVALDRSEKLLRNIYDYIPVGVELYDKNGLLVEINNKDIEIFGIVDKDMLRGMANFFDNPVVPVEIRERVRKHEEFSFRLDYPFGNVGTYYESSKAGYIEVYTSVSMIYDEHGEVINFMLINIDNTEINRAHSRLAEFESSFSLVSRYGKVGYCRVDILSKEGFAMPQWYYNLGEKDETPLDQVIGVYNNVDPVDRPAVKESVRQIVAGEISGFNHDLHIIGGDEDKWTRINVVRNPMNTDPTKLEIVCVNYDITELKRTEKSLIEAKNRAEVSDKLKSAFLANMSHEIRTPLNAIVGFSNLIAESEDAIECGEYAHIVQENNELLLKLIGDILDLSKIEAGTLEFSNSDVDVNQMCQEVVRSMSIKVVGKPVELRLADALPECYLNGDKSRIMQVLNNFINNALKFTHEGSIVLSYKCDMKSKMLTFYVEDTGVGIPEQELNNVFGRFVKLNNFAQGTGLGLAICKSIVEQMGGSIGVNSHENEGSCFWFSHPYIKA